MQRMDVFDDKLLIDNVIFKYMNGESINNIRKDLDLSYEAVQRILIEFKIPGYIYEDGTFTVFEEREILKMYSAGQSFSKIFKKYNQKTNVLKFLVKNGMTFTKGRRINDNFFDNWTPESAYVYGMLLADGHIEKEEGRNRITLKQVNKEIIGKVKRALSYTGKTYEQKVEGKANDYYVIKISSSRIKDKLLELGLGGDKTYEGETPKTLPTNLQGHFIRGFFDGDGFVRTSGRGLTLTTASKKLANQLENMLCENNINAYIVESKSKVGSNIYRVSVSGYIESAKMFNFMYHNSNNLYIKYKYDRFLNNKFVKDILEENDVNLKIA